MSFNASAAGVFDSLRTNAKYKSRAEREIEANLTEIEQLGDSIMRIEYLCDVIPDAKKDIMFRWRDAQYDLMRVLLKRNCELEECVSAFDDLTRRYQPYLN